MSTSTMIFLWFLYYFCLFWMFNFKNHPFFYLVCIVCFLFFATSLWLNCVALHIVNWTAEHCSNSRLCMTFLLLKANTGHHVVAVFLFVRSLFLVPTGMDVHIVVSLVPLFVVVFFLQFSCCCYCCCCCS